MPLSKEAILGILGVGAAGLSGGFNFVSSGFSARRSYKYALRLMDHQYDLTRQLNQNAYQDTTSSMRNAGINPMLAITQGVNGLSAGSGGSVSVNDPQVGSSSFQAYQDYKRLKNEIELKDSQKNLNKSQENLNTYSADVAHEQAALTNEQNRLLQQFGPLKAKAEINAITANTAKAMNDMNNANRLTTAQINNLNTSAKESSIRSKTYTVKTGKGIKIPKFGDFGFYKEENVR